jgi:cell shape-determining protein MreD
MPVLVGIPVLLLAVILQTTAFSRLPMLYGIPDIVMLVVLAWFLDEHVKHGWEWVVMAGIMVSFVSALPLFLPLWGYLGIAILCYFLKNRIWQTPIMAMLASTLIGTVLMQTASIFALQITGVDVPLQESLRLIILPSILWNLLLAIPVYSLVKELIYLVYPGEVDE